MRLLADTHVVLWALSDPAELHAGAADALRDPRNDVLVSVASLWEIALKAALGKLRLPSPAAEWLPGALARTSFDALDIRAAHALAAGALPPHHRDPFDRVLVAQALLEGLILVTRDARFASYGVRTLRA